MSLEASRRVLDMLAGWSQYADSCITAAPPDRTEEELVELDREADMIADLYQEFGRNVANEDESYINDFITNKIIPFILKGK